MYRACFDNNIEARASSKRLIQLYAEYQALAAHGLPDYADFNPTKLRAFSDSISVLALQPNGEFLYTFVGRALGATFDFEIMGRGPCVFGDKLGEFLTQTSRQAIDNGKPLYTLHRPLPADDTYLWERLILPVRLGHENFAVLGYSCMRPFEVDFARALFEASDDGIIGVTAVRDEYSRIVDARVGAANLRASAILNVPLNEIENRLLSEAAPHLRQSVAWPAILEAIGTHCPYDLELLLATAKKPIWLRLNITPLHDGVVIKISDITASKEALLELDRQRAELTYANQVLEAQAAELSEIAFEAELARASLSEEVTRRIALEEDLKRLARHDLLTGVSNRLGFEEIARQMLATAQRYQHEFSVILVDADHFKTINDSFGHAGGDEALKHLARLLAEGVRKEIDCVGRIGGEEFALLLPQTGLDGAVLLAERLRKHLVAHPVEFSGRMIEMTASFGVATLSDHTATIDQMMQKADLALYEAKRAGRNLVRANKESRNAA